MNKVKAPLPRLKSSRKQMQTTESLKRRMKSAGDLLSVVKTMKAFAAVSIRQYQKAVESLTDYNSTVEMGLQIVLKERMGAATQRKRRTVKRLGAIVFGSDQGFCGQLNDQISVFTLDYMKEKGIKKENRKVLSVGARVADYLEDAGQTVNEFLTTPSSTAGITPLVQEIIMIIDEWHFQHQVDHFVLYYNKYISGSHIVPTWFNSFLSTGNGSRKLPRRNGIPNHCPFFGWMGI